MLSNSSGLAESRDDWLVAMRVWTPEANVAITPYTSTKPAPSKKAVSVFVPTVSGYLCCALSRLVHHRRRDFARDIACVLTMGCKISQPLATKDMVYPGALGPKY